MLHPSHIGVLELHFLLARYLKSPMIGIMGRTLAKLWVQIFIHLRKPFETSDHDTSVAE